MDHPFQSPAIISLCPGMRGLERGIERAIGGIRTLAYVEIEAFVAENLVQQMEQGLLAPAPVHTNVKTFAAYAGLFRGKVHGITGGYPCQPFSLAGRREGAGDPRHLWPYIECIIDAARPLWCFFENVDDHLSLGFEEVLRSLHRLGYRVEAGVFSADEVGAPHERKRLFVLAILEDAHDRGDGRWNHGDTYRDSGALQAQGSGGSKESELDDTLRGRHVDAQGQIQAGRERAELPGRELGDAASPGLPLRRYGGGIGKEDGGIWNGGIEYAGGDELANSGEQRSETGISKQEQWEERQPEIIDDNRDRWPARRGEEQYDWEAPRLESRLGFSTSRYNFREDLLRMAGNAVVEQVAELAFRTLLNKFNQ